MTDVVAICGSLRKNALSRKLFRLAVRELEEKHGLSVEQVDLKLLALPVYDGDVEDESGIPEQGRALKERISKAPGLLFVSPEYNANIPGGLKNAIDWLSRPPGNCFAGRVASVNTASDGAFGGARCTIALKATLSHLGAWVVPAVMNLPKAQHAFDAQGELTEEWMRKALSGSMQAFAEGVKRFRAPLG